MSVAPQPAVTDTPPERLPWGLAWALSIGQINAWGILYYAFTVVVGPMQAATGWSRNFLNSGISLGLLACGLFSLPVGAWIQRRGGRAVMAVGSVAGGAALALIAVPDRAVYLVAWLLLGVAMAGMLYNSAFAVVTHAFGAHYRRGITLITLVAGLASTVFIPLAQLAVDHLGWQQALVALGAFHAAVGLPLHALAIPRLPRATNVTDRRRPGERWAAWWREFRRDISDPRFVGLAIWFTAHGAGFIGLIFQLVPAWQALGVSTPDILTAIAIIGPMQVLGRLALVARGDQFSTLKVGRWAMAAVIAGVAILLFLPARLPWLALFATLFGVGNGVGTILRGTAIAELFGRERYAELNGALSAPAVLATAAPLAMAAVWSGTGEPLMVFAAVLALFLLGVLGLLMADRAQRRRTPHVPAAAAVPVPPA